VSQCFSHKLKVAAFQKKFSYVIINLFLKVETGVPVLRFMPNQFYYFSWNV